MSARLQGQVGVVTGAGRGIGRAIALALAAEGMGLALLARGSAQVRETAELVERLSVPCLPVAADVTDVDAVRRLLAHAEQRLGPIDLLINNAGATDPTEAALWEADLEALWRVVTVNLRGPLVCCAVVLPSMIGRGRGRVVNINSLVGTRPSATSMGYAVSKAALFRLTDCLGTALRGSGVSVFDLSPGLVRTAMTRDMPRWRSLPAEEWTPPERVAEVVVEAATGRYDALSGRFLHATEDLDALLAAVALAPDGDARVLRLVPYGPDDPIFR